MQESLHHPLKLAVSKALKEALQLSKLVSPDQISLDKIYSLLSAPPKKEMGHLCFACFELAKVLKMAPPKIAEQIAQAIPEHNDFEFNAQGPYINFKLSCQMMGRDFLSLVLNQNIFKQKLSLSSEKTMIEYSQPNTHKDMHVGHMRNLSYGDSLVRIFTYCGQEVIPVTYPGDLGTHVAKCLWYIKKFDYKFGDDLSTVEKGRLLGEVYTLSTQVFSQQADTNQSEENNNEITLILKQLHGGAGEYFDLWQETRSWSLDLMHHIYDWAHVSFDKWFYESDVDASSVELVKKFYQDGKLVKDQGAIGMDLSDDNLGFCLLLKSDGTGLYATKDIELAVKKFDEFNIQNNFYIVDNRQAHHFNQVFKVLEKLGYPQAKNSHHLQYAFVELVDGAMSSRKGNILSLLHLIQEMENTIKKNYLNKYLENNEWTQKEVDETAHILAEGAIKYGMTKVDNNRKIIFDMNEWLKLDGDTGPYLQYVSARIHSLLKQIPYTDKENIDWSLLESESEKNVLIKLSFFNDIVYQCFQGQKTISLCSYLFELCKLYNSFYAECSIAKSQDDLKDARLALSESTRIILTKGLELLGISSPERM